MKIWVSRISQKTGTGQEWEAGTTNGKCLIKDIISIYKLGFTA